MLTDKITESRQTSCSVALQGCYRVGGLWSRSRPRDMLAAMSAVMTWNMYVANSYGTLFPEL